MQCVNRTRGSWLVVLIVAIILTGGIAGAQSNEELFQQGNAAYQQGHYDEAIARYSAVVDRQIHHAAVFYNLANSCFKKGDLARAILFYERALKLEPRDRDIRRNLQFARSQTADRIEDPNPSILLAVLRGIHHYLSLNEWTILVSSLFVLLCGLIIHRLLLVGPLARDLNFYALVVITSIFLGSLGFCGAKVHEAFYEKDAVVTAQKVEIRSGPAQTYTILLQLHAGTKVDVVQEVEGWTQVRLANGYEGWIPDGSIEII
jgi:tetratricopeptide (TPR) repeat protein